MKTQNSSLPPGPGSPAGLSPSVPSPEEIADGIVRFVERKRNPYMAPEVPAQLYREEIADAIRTDREHRHRELVWPNLETTNNWVEKRAWSDSNSRSYYIFKDDLIAWLRTEVERLNPELLKTTNLEKISTSPAVQSDKGDNK